MQSIISETEQTIALKRMQAQESQMEVNEMVFNMHNKVRRIYQLKNEAEVLERDLDSLKKQRSHEGANKAYCDGGPMQSTESDNRCFINSPGGPIPR